MVAVPHFERASVPFADAYQQTGFALGLTGLIANFQTSQHQICANFFCKQKQQLGYSGLHLLKKKSSQNFKILSTPWHNSIEPVYKERK